MYGYNTDGIFIANPKIKFKNKKKNIKFNTNKIGKAYRTDAKLVYFEEHYRENIDYDSYKVKKGKGCIFNGQAGSGKTTKLCKMVSEATNPLVLSFTNKAIENVKDRLTNMKYERDKVIRTCYGKVIDMSKLNLSDVNNRNEANNICHTFDSYFFERNGKDISCLKGKTIFIEEFSMVPNKWMTKIYEAFTKFNNKIYMFGDPNQCEPVEGSQIHSNYLETITINEMCPKVETLTYIEK